VLASLALRLRRSALTDLLQCCLGKTFVGDTDHLFEVHQRLRITIQAESVLDNNNTRVGMLASMRLPYQEPLWEKRVRRIIADWPVRDVLRGGITVRWLRIAAPLRLSMLGIAGFTLPVGIASASASHAVMIGAILLRICARESP
jgi:hypothetical protein